VERREAAVSIDRETLARCATELGFPLVGEAPADGFPGVPPATRSVLVLGMPALDPAFDLELYLEESGEKQWSKWAYERLAAGAARLALLLRQCGEWAEPLTYEDSLSLLDLKVAAVRAGLGVWGLNNLVLTRRYGPRVRFGAVLTSAVLPPDRPLADYYCVSCSLCLAACPTGALGPGRFDRSLCLAEFDPDAEMASRQRQLLTFPTPHTRLQCAECISACPVGKAVSTRFWGLDPRLE
jgi:epoxyqueuosine reductase